MTFTEKASFATQLVQSDYDRQTIVAALSLYLPMVSRLLKVGAELPIEFLRCIGSAPGIGRDRRTALVKLFADDPLARRRAYEASRSAGFADLNSDDRFAHAYTAATKARRTGQATPAPKARTLRGRDGSAIATSAAPGAGSP